MYVLKNKQRKDGETNKEEMGELFAPRCSHVLLVAPQTQSALHKADIFFQQSRMWEENSTFPHGIRG